MKQFQISYTNSIDLRTGLGGLKQQCGNVADSKLLFYITWSVADTVQITEVTEIIEELFPESGFYGNQTSGNIVMGEAIEGINISCIIFEAEDSYAKTVFVSDNSDITCLDELWSYCNSETGIRAIELIPSMSFLDSLHLDCNIADVRSDIVLFGGASSSIDFNPYRANVLVKGSPLTYEGMAVVLYYGKTLNVTSDYVLGWKGLGRQFVVTKSNNKQIIEIDKMPAYTIYEKYLNLSIADRDMIVFPLLVEEEGTKYIRTAHTINQDKSMSMFVNIPVGTKVQLSYGDKNTILDGTYNKALEIADLKPELIKAYSCAGRRLFWGNDEVGKETVIFNDIAPISGFYSGGEILRFGKRIRVMNQTLVLVSMSEGNNNKNTVKLKDRSFDRSLVSRLAYFTQKVCEEQGKTNRQLEEDKSLLRENMGMIKGLAEEYLALFYVNIDEATYKIYSIKDVIVDKVYSIFADSEIGLDVFKKFGTVDFIHPDDRYLFAQIDKNYIRENLADRKKFSIRFRQKFNDKYLWMEMDIVKYDALDECANEIAVGFAERDSEIRTEQVTTSCFNILKLDLSPSESINELLTLVGDFYDAEYCRIFEYKDKKHVINNTFEWCAEKSKHLNGKLSNIPNNSMDSILSSFKQRGGYFLNPSEASEKGLTEKYGIKSLIAVPVLNGTDMGGLIAVVNPSYAVDNITVLKNAAAVAMSELLRVREKDEEHTTLEKLADTFLSVYYVDLGWDYMHTWKIDSSYQDAYGSVEHYSVSMGDYVRNCIAEADRIRCIKMTSPNYILKQFKNKDRFSIEMTDIMLGYERDVVFDYVKINEDGTQFVVCCRDISEAIAKEKAQQKQLQDALEAADAANKSKTSFLFNMSHDIRTPMNAIIGFTNMAIKHIDDREKALDCLVKTQKSGGMLLSLINSVLEVSRIESGISPLEEQHGDIYNSFLNIETTMSELATTKNITLTFEFGDIKNRYVICDFGSCMRIFVNIISNAIKYTPNGGKVCVRCEQTGEANNGYGLYCYTVEDNGIGMSEEFQKHVFEQFSREKTSTVSGIQGTGLGMAVCKSFVDLMGGTIECTSKQGVGTKFTITLPLKIQDGDACIDAINDFDFKEEIVRESADRSLFAGKRVLLVDDNEMNREIAVDILSDAGFNIEAADDGLAAVELLGDKGPDYYDFILMDIQMPIMNGYEASKRIHEMYPDSDICIVALSANAFAEDRQASIDAGMCDHVAKPINIEKLFRVLGKYI